MKTGLLFIDQQFIRLTSLAIRAIIQRCASDPKSPQRLYVVLRPRTACTRITSSLFEGLSRVYCQAFRVDTDLDVRVFLGNLKRETNQSSKPCSSAVDVVFTDALSSRLPDAIKISPTATTVSLEPLHLPAENVWTQRTLDREEQWKTYDNVVIGGACYFPCNRSINQSIKEWTQHARSITCIQAIKLLLSNAILRCNKRLTIGVTVQSMLKKKHLADLIQPIEERTRVLQQFCTDVDPFIEYNIVPISDPFGPSTVDPDLQAIIASEETLAGAEAVNVERRKKNLNLLQVHTFPVHDVEDHSPTSDLRTISSSWYRQNMLGRLISPPIPRAGLPSRLYLIGLTGGSGSGKTKIGEYLATKPGVLLVDCDKIAHEAYRKDTALHARLIAEYGPGIVDRESGEIARKELGKIVFSAPAAREKLNSLIWPEVLDYCRRKIEEAKPKVAFIDAALLLEAGWASSLHEVWVTFVPEEEAIRRIVERDGVNEEYARARIHTQMSNQARIPQANVVFCSLWDYSVTHSQVDRAWKEFLERTPQL